MASDLAREALEPCPFCGNDGNGPIEDALHVRHEEHEWRPDSWSVQCDKCSANMGYSDSPDEAVADWNRRARTDDAIGSGVKALEWRPHGMLGTTAKTPFGDYHISEDLFLGCIWLERQKYLTLDEAKTAAQADFERRVLSCLSPVAVEEADAKAGRDRLPPNHYVLEQADLIDGTGRVAQTVSIGPEASAGAAEYQRIVHADEAYGSVSTPSLQIGKAGAGPVGEAVAYAQGVLESIRDFCGEHRTDANLNRVSAMGVDVAIMKLAARPVVEPGEALSNLALAYAKQTVEIERLTRERNRATGLWRGAILRAETAEAALAEARERLGKAEAAARLTVSDASHHLAKYRPHCLAALTLALTGDAQEAKAPAGDA